MRHVLLLVVLATMTVSSASARTSNPDSLLSRGDFVSRSAGPLHVHAWRGSAASAKIDSILSVRARALGTLCELLETAPPDSVHIFFYPDRETKLAQTGHRGLGWGEGTTVVEVFNDSTQVDPYHELAHIALYTIGKPPPMWDEGFAVYVSKRLGADALRYMGYPGGAIDESLLDRLAGGEPYEWQELTGLAEIGDADDVVLAYLQSASVVTFVATEFGDAALREILRYVATNPEREPLARADEALLQATGKSGEELWTEWRDALKP